MNTKQFAIISSTVSLLGIAVMAQPGSAQVAFDGAVDTGSFGVGVDGGSVGIGVAGNGISGGLAVDSNGVSLGIGVSSGPTFAAPYAVPPGLDVSLSTTPEQETSPYQSETIIPAAVGGARPVVTEPLTQTINKTKQHTSNLTGQQAAVLPQTSSSPTLDQASYALMAPDSINNAPIPSGIWSYGFPNESSQYYQGVSHGGTLGAGLPQVATSSVDLNVVDGPAMSPFYSGGAYGGYGGIGIGIGVGGIGIGLGLSGGALSASISGAALNQIGSAISTGLSDAGQAISQTADQAVSDVQSFFGN